jgi:aminopeptidase C
MVLSGRGKQKKGESQIWQYERSWGDLIGFDDIGKDWWPPKS